MQNLIFTRFYRMFPQFINSFSTLNTGAEKSDKLLSHVYRKIWTKEQIIKYIQDNVVYESERYIITSLPQGIVLKKTSICVDNVTPLACDADLNEIMENLSPIFNVDKLFLSVYPRSNASGLTIFAKTYDDKAYLQKTIKSSLKNYQYNFLAVVLGCPKQSLTQTFGVAVTKVKDKYFTSILKQWKTSKKIRSVCYSHEVLASSPLASLVKIQVSQDVRDCVRHILGTQCLTPVLGDIWHCVKKSSSFLGSQILIDEPFLDFKSVSLDPELLAKLKLQPGDESLIPIHTHLYSLRASIDRKKKIFVSVPPPESFVWSCNQLGFEAIKNYQSVK